MKELQELERYSLYLTVKSEALEDKQKRLLDELTQVSKELEILDKEKMETVRQVQVLLSRKIEEEITE